MFEQALLSTGQQPVARRAMAAALTAQFMGVALVIAISMAYVEKIAAPPNVHLIAPPLIHEIPPRPSPVQPAKSNLPALAAPRVLSPQFQQPVHQHIVMDTAAPELTPPTTDLNIGHGLSTPFTDATAIGNMANSVFSNAAPPQAAVAAPEKRKAGPVTIGGQVLEAMLIHRVLPVYPAIAKQIRLSGTVELFGVIATDGRVKELRVVSGHPILAKAAIDAVQQWTYRPTLLNGKPVEVSAPIFVRFQLNQ